MMPNNNAQSQCGRWPQPNPKHEFRNPKQIQITKNSNFKTNGNSLKMQELQRSTTINEQKKQEVDGL
jgi:hypothetical protein